MSKRTANGSTTHLQNGTTATKRKLALLAKGADSKEKHEGFLTTAASFVVAHQIGKFPKLHTSSIIGREEIELGRPYSLEHRKYRLSVLDGKHIFSASIHEGMLSCVQATSLSHNVSSMELRHHPSAYVYAVIGVKRVPPTDTR